MSRNDRWLMGGMGFLLVASFVALSLTADLHHRIPRFLFLYGIAFVAYAVALARALRKGDAWSRRALWWVLGVAVVARVAVVPAEPVMSTDVYRYLWEGRVILSGHNPFEIAPDSPELESLRDQFFEEINHKELETIYPPLAQGVFAVGAWIQPHPTAQKALFSLFDLATIFVLLTFLRLREMAPIGVIVHAWNPLVIFETSHSGHVDAVGVFFLVLALLWFSQNASARGTVALAGSFLVKYVAVILGPYLVLRKRHAIWLPVAAVIVLLGYLPFISAGTRLFSSLQVYGMEWQFNGLPYRFVELTGADSGGIRLLLAVITAVFVAVRAVRCNDIVEYTFSAVACVLLMSPTLYPWYVVWMVPLLCLRPSRAWILFTGLVFTSYWVWVVLDLTGEWHLTPVVYLIEYLPFYALFLWDMRGRSNVRMETV